MPPGSVEPRTELFSGLGLYLWMWGIFTTYMFVASLRTTGAVALVFLLLAITFIMLGIGNSALAGTTNVDQRHDQARRLLRDRDGDRGVVRVVRGGDQLDLRPDGGAGLPAERAETKALPYARSGVQLETRQPHIRGQLGRRRDRAGAPG